MILEGNFYKIEKIEEREANTYVVGVEMMPEHPIYAGHFPQQAVVPGVCTLTIIKEVIGKILSRKVIFSAIKDCKYISALIPQPNLHIKIDLTLGDEGKVVCVVERSDNQQAVLKLKATIE